MKMKKDPEHPGSPALIKKLSRLMSSRPVLAWAGAFLVCFIVILVRINTRGSFDSDIDEFEVGKVAGRDVVAEKGISYRDEQATSFRIASQLRLVQAVFQFSVMATAEQMAKWEKFAALAADAAGQSPQAYKQAIQSEFPGYFSDDALDLLYGSNEREQMLIGCAAILDQALERGIYLVPQTGLEELNPDWVELIRMSGTRIEQEKVPMRNVTTPHETGELVNQLAAAANSPELEHLAPQLITPLLHENVFYSREETIKRINETLLRTEPVMRNIEHGKRIIKKGFVVTEEEMADFNAIKMTVQEKDFPMILANVLFLLLLFGLLWYFCGERIIGRNLSNREVYLVSFLSALYIAGSVLVRDISVGSMPASVVVPTALVIMLPSILIHPRLALLLAMALPLGAFLTGSFDAQSYIFAIVSGVVAAYSLQRAEKRMDLVKAGLFIAAANVTAMFAILLWQHSLAGLYPHTLFWAAFNGVASGMLVLGLLSPLETALNAATTFRLIELSDLNAPILRRLFTAAPGTYSHSIMVANLAEAACQDIGANSLLARVGAYYHDLGKMENPEYYVENQTDYNCHDDLAPRLSATVIRSHVKLGVEKARQLRLPQEVIDIISEHHGNSLITWFYSKAIKQEGKNSRNAPVNAEDFCYQGNPPRSRESAVVMLADVTEAAVRTLNKPTAVKIEKFMQELFARKEEHGQLAQSELTFRDLEVIKNAFVQVLAGYYHSRIEYPKISESANKTEEE